MKKEKKTKNLCVMWCLFANVPLCCLLTIKDFNQDLPWIHIGILVVIFFTNLIGVIMLTNHYNDWIQSEKDEFIVKLEQITDEYKECVKDEKRCPFNDPYSANYNICKTLEMITETFCDKKSDDARLNTLKTVIEAVINSHEADKQPISNSEQGQKNNKRDTNV